MAVTLHHPEVMRLRNRYHWAKTDRALWARVKALVLADHVDQAEALAKAHVTATPHRQAHQKGSRLARAQRAAWLRQQQGRERELKDALAALGDGLAGVLTRAAGPDGKIRPTRVHAIYAELKARNAAAYRAVNKTFLSMVRQSVRAGVRAAVAVGIEIVGHLKNSRAKSREESSDILNPREASRAFAEGSLLKGREGKGKEGKGKEYDLCGEPAGAGPPPAPEAPLFEAEDDGEDDEFDGPDPVRQKVDYAERSAVFEKVFQGALETTMENGLFGETGVSSRVWDLRDQNYLALKRLVAGGIAQGKSAGDIAAEVQGMLIQPEPFNFSYGGPGIYRSAYKNALRLTRTETTRAYGTAMSEFADEKGWQVVWHVSDGQREEDECDDLDGEEMSPEEFQDKYPQHPNCLCYSTLVVPDVEEDAPESDDAAPADDGDPGL